jgi:hypothetical protein
MAQTASKNATTALIKFVIGKAGDDQEWGDDDTCVVTDLLYSTSRRCRQYCCNIPSYYDVDPP